jgi:hypothetical protein
MARQRNCLSRKLRNIALKPHDSDDGILALASDFQPSNDLLSDILRFVHLTGERVFTAELGTGFRVLFQPGSACIHVIQEGLIDIEVEGQSPLRLSAGDIAVLPHPAKYALTDGANRESETETTLELDSSGVQSTVLRHGNGAIAARTISATFRFDNTGGVSPLLKLLPEVIHIARDADQSAVLIRDIAQFLVIEVTKREPGAALMISRVIDILIIRCIRTWAKTLGTRQGWVGALADTRVPMQWTNMPQSCKSWRRDCRRRCAAFRRSSQRAPDASARPAHGPRPSPFYARPSLRFIRRSPSFFQRTRKPAAAKSATAT